MHTENETIYYDKIVDGYNKNWIEKRYNEIKCLPFPSVLVHFNIKNFRYLNTLYGHAEANDILKIIYHQIKNILGEDEFLCHSFADNFLLILVNKNPENYQETDDFTKERMLELIDALYRINDERIYRNLFCSIGIFNISNDGTSFETAVTYANLARKECAIIKNRSFCYEIYEDKAKRQYMERCELENKTADAYKNYEFTAFLQPKVDPKTNKIIGAEALLRWFDKDGKMIPVNEFLPILDLNGYISLVDLDVFEIICKMWHENFEKHQPYVPISFNISKSCFYQDDCIQPYLELCEKYQIPKDLVEFELMESITLDDTKHMKNMIHKFKEAGFKCSLDDFGSGYSSFNVLLNADLSTVKLDRQFFIKNLNGDSKLIIRTVIDLIKSLHMKIVAEGVETQEYVDFLRECECDIIQGFYYYRPMPINEFNEILQKQEESV